MKITKLPPDHAAHTKLAHIHSPPKQLFIYGNFQDMPLVSIIGSRKHSSYGKYATQLVAGELARAGVGIVSGLALGIDSIAHRAAIEAGGVTHAIMPSGLKNIYPASHRSLALEIVEHGGSLISEYPPKTTMYKSRFVERNRLVAGLGDALVVVEAADKSGTLHTVNFALEQGKEVFAVPGQINSQTSKGTNRLIQTGAQLLSDPSQITEYLGLSELKAAEQIALKLDDESQSLIYEQLKAGEMIHAEILQSYAKLSTHEFTQALSMLEIYGHIKNVGNNTWVKT